MNRTVFLFFEISVTVCILFFSGCPTPENTSNSDSSGSPIIIDTDKDKNMWTWASGSDTVNQSGTYGTIGTAAATNIPGSRGESISWIDSSGNFWLFGGYGYDKNGDHRYLNDLWKYDGSNWTWMSGSAWVDQSSTYGTKGTPAAANIPGSRYQSISWIDSSGNLWLFGGRRVDGDDNTEYLNDLWKYDGTNWTWMSGSDAPNQKGTYGTKGTPAAANIPGSRYESISWIDSSGNLWLFGGLGYSATKLSALNDLWKYDGTDWTWVSGSDLIDQSGTYGTKGTPAAANIPGGRYNSISWIDSSGNLWLFGGYGNDKDGNHGKLNDLWKYDGVNWTWVSGSDLVDQSGTYGTKGTAAAANTPGARQSSISWIDSSGNLWLYGGYGNDKDGNEGYLNDLWKYNGTNWTWISGSDTPGQKGTYGTKGTAASANASGARQGSISWIDSSGNLLLFSGYGYDKDGNQGYLNDLWMYKP